MNVQLILTLVILVAMIVGFLSGKFKLGLVAMTAATLLCLTGVLTFDEAYANFANKNVIMIGGMFILSGALSKTSLVSRVRDFMVSHGDKAKLIIFLYMVINVLLIQVSMPTALASMFLPFMASFTGDSKVKASDLIYPGAVVAHCAQGLMPGAMFVLINSILEANNAGVDITAVDYSRVIFVPAIVALLYCGIVAPRLLSKRDFVTAADTSSQSGKKASTLAAWQESLIYVAFVVNLLCMLFSDALPFSMNVVPVALDIILLYTKCLDLNDVKNFMNVDTLFMLVGVMCLGTAMQKTGEGTVVGDFIMNLLGKDPSPVLVLFVFYFAGATLTQFMSNTASQQVFVALAVVTCIANGLDPRPYACAIFAGCTAAMLTPAASPSIGISFGAGNYKFKEVFFVFLPLWIIYGIAVCLSASFVFPLAG